MEIASSKTQFPAPSAVEQALTPLVDTVIYEAKTGYNWKGVDSALQEYLGLSSSRCKKASGSGRAANVLTESNDKSIDLYVVFITGSYSADKFADIAVDRIKRFPNVKTVAIAEKLDGYWRVTALLERAGIEVADELLGHFPLVNSVRYVQADFAQHTSPGSFEKVDADVFEEVCKDRETKVSDFDILVKSFREFLVAEGVVVDSDVVLDLLASALSGQFLLFAGPSGTGKSTLARALGRFFSGQESFQVIEAARKWIGPEDVAGFYSNISGRFAETVHTSSLLALHDASVVSEGDEASTECPFLLVEEMNLSPIEGYLNPWTHGLSGRSAPMVQWRIHAGIKPDSREDGNTPYPETLVFGPYPRLVGTLNVDQESSAPARKVISRATVILLEPDDSLDEDQVAALALKTPQATTAGQGARWMGDPSAALKAIDSEIVESFPKALTELLKMVDPQQASIQLSRRQYLRMFTYMAYFFALATSDGADSEHAKQVAAENCLVHFVLPLLDPHAFRTVVAFANKAQLSAKPLGGMLASRLKRLGSIEERDQYEVLTLDFWSALA